VKDERRRSVEPGICGGELLPLDMAVAEVEVDVPVCLLCAGEWGGFEMEERGRSASEW
jgi:hypothetical protein